MKKILVMVALAFVFSACGSDSDNKNSDLVNPGSTDEGVDQNLFKVWAPKFANRRSAIVNDKVVLVEGFAILKPGLAGFATHCYTSDQTLNLLVKAQVSANYTKEHIEVSQEKRSDVSGGGVECSAHVRKSILSYELNGNGELKIEADGETLLWIPATATERKSIGE